MSVDRRQFIRVGAAALVASSACHKTTNPEPSPQPSPGGTDGRPTASADSNRLQVTISGLYLIEEKGSSAVVHLVDATKIGMPEHRARLKVPASTIDQTKVAKPDPTHVQAAGVDEFWIWDLAGANVTMPSSPSAAPDLSFDPPSNEDGQDVPATDGGWHSLARVPDLRVVCGATHITRYDAMASSVALTHGRVTVLKPGDLGSGAVWNFADPSGKQLLHRAVSDKFAYVCPGDGRALSIQVGAQTIVFKAGATINAQMENLPVKGQVCPCPPPNMDHFAAMAQLVDKSFVPTITLAGFKGIHGADAGTDYCPGGRA